MAANAQTRAKHLYKKTHGLQGVRKAVHSKKGNVSVAAEQPNLAKNSKTQPAISQRGPRR